MLQLKAVEVSEMEQPRGGGEEVGVFSVGEGLPLDGEAEDGEMVMGGVKGDTAADGEGDCVGLREMGEEDGDAVVEDGDVDANEGVDDGGKVLAGTGESEANSNWIICAPEPAENSKTSDD